MIRLFIILIFNIVIVGCSGGAARVSENPIAVITPKNLPVKNVSSFDHSLACIDELLLLKNPKKIILINENMSVENQSGVTEGVITGVRQMIIHTVNSMSIKSKKVLIYGIDSSNFSKYLDGLTTVAGQLAHAAGKQAPEVPDFLVMGAITQVEKDAQKGGSEFDMALGKAAEIQFADTKGVSVVSLSLSFADLFTSIVPPGLSTDNIMSVVKSDDGFSIKGGLINYGGGGYSVQFRRAEGMSAAFRTLVQLNMIQLIGKHFELDYEQCLNPETSSKVIQEAYLEKERINSEKSSIRQTNIEASNIGIDITPIGAGIRVGENIKFRVSSNRDSFLYCFYQEANGRITRIFPNHLINQDKIGPGNNVIIPGTAKIEITAEKVEPREVLFCVGSQSSLDSFFPTQLKKEFASSVMTWQDLLSSLKNNNAPSDIAYTQFVIDPK